MGLFDTVIFAIAKNAGATTWEEIKSQLRIPLRRAIEETKHVYKSKPGIRNGLDRWFKEGALDYYAGKVFRGEDVNDESVARSFLEHAELGPIEEAEKLEVAERVVRALVRNLRDVALEGEEGLRFLGRRVEHKAEETHQRLDQIRDILETHLLGGDSSGQSEGEIEAHLLKEKELVDLLYELPDILQDLQAQRGRSKRSEDIQRRSLPLPSKEREALGLIATAPISPRPEWLEAIFPNRDWDSLISSLSTRELIRWDENHLSLPESVKERVLEAEEEQVRLDETWFDALRPHRLHPDVAIFLALKYIGQNNVGSAIRSLVDSVYLVEPGSENDLLCSALEPILTQADLEDIDELSDHDITRTYNAFGLCLARNGRNEEALSWFDKLHDHSRSVNDAWGIGQAYINSGVANFYLGNEEKAKSSYEKAVKHARRQENEGLLSRALSNLASLKADSDPDRAIDLLEESEELKQSDNDYAGLVGTKLNRGTIAVEAGNLKRAERHFKHAVEEADRLDRRYLKAIALQNLGSVRADQGRPDDALSSYSEAQDLSEEQDLRYPLRLTLRGKGVVLTQNGAYANAIPVFERLHQLEHKAGNIRAATGALHDLGVCLNKAGHPEKGQQTLRRSLHQARRDGLDEWIYRNQATLAATHKGNGSTMVVSQLEKAANSEMERGNFNIAGRLWISASEEALKQQEVTEDSDPDGEPAAVICPLQEALMAFQKAGNTEKVVEVYGRIYDFRRSRGAYQKALDVLEEAQGAIPEDHPEGADFEDERGACLQRLGRYEEAEDAHIQSLRTSRKIDDDRGAETSLNNLGELYRKTGRPKQAVETYEKAENRAQSRDDQEERLSIAHNRALALSDLGRLKEAKDLMGQIEAEAGTTGSTRELARALHGKAILAWQDDPCRDTLSLFKNAVQRSKELGEVKTAIDAGINYSSLLLEFDEDEKAIRTLQPLENIVAEVDLPQQYSYFVTLAETYEQNGDLPNARSCWSHARHIARRIEDKEKALTSLFSLARLDEREGFTNEADDKFQTALQYASGPQDKARVLASHLDIGFMREDDRMIESLEENTKELTEKYELDEIYIDIQMKIGDYYLGKSRRRHFEGCQHYAAALARAQNIFAENASTSEETPEPMSQVGVHIFLTLSSLDVDDRTNHLQRLVQQLQKWAVDEVESIKDTEPTKYLLWPFTAAQRLSEETEESVQPDPKHARKIIDEELRKLIPDDM